MSTQTKRQQDSNIDRIFEALCKGELTAKLYSSDPEFSAAAIADWQADHANQQRLEQFRAAFEMQGILMAAKARTEAVANMLRIIHDPQSPAETVRKACSEILKMAARWTGRGERQSRSRREFESSQREDEQFQNQAAAVAAASATERNGAGTRRSAAPVVRLSGNGIHADQPLSSAIDAVPARLSDFEGASAVSELDPLSASSRLISSNGWHH